MNDSTTIVRAVVMMLIFALASLAKARAKGNANNPIWDRWVFSLRSAATPRIFIEALRGFLLLFGAVAAGTQGASLVPCVLLGAALGPALLVPVLTRLGLPRGAYICTRLTYYGGGRAAALFNELRAIEHHDRPFDSSALRSRVNRLFDADSDVAVRGRTLAALATYNSISGDVAGARAMFDVVMEMPSRHAGRTLRCYCQKWRLMEAQRREAYSEVVEIALRGPRTFLAAAARVRALQALRLPHPRPWFARLIHGLDNIGIAPRAQSLGATGPVRLSLEFSATSLAAVRASTFDALRLAPGEITKREVRALALAWQETLEMGDVSEWFYGRVEALQVPTDVNELEASFEQEVIHVVSHLWCLVTVTSALVRDTAFRRLTKPFRRKASATEPNDGDILAYAKDAIMSELLGHIEPMARELESGNVDSDTSLSELWQNWARLRMALRTFEQLLPERIGALVADVGGAILNHGAWLFNKRQARVLADNVFGVLAGIYPQEHTDYNTVRKNVRISSRV